MILLRGQDVLSITTPWRQLFCTPALQASLSGFRLDVDRGEIALESFSCGIVLYLLVLLVQYKESPFHTMKMTAEEQREFRWQLSLTDEQMKFCATQPQVEDGPGAVTTAMAGLSRLDWHILLAGDGGVKPRSGDGKQNRSVCGLSRLRASDALVGGGCRWL